MKVLNLRHIGLVSRHLEESRQLYERLGFELIDEGTDIINGQAVLWIKMKNAQGIVLEFQREPNAIPHLAFTVDKVNPEAYFYIAPSGHKVQMDQDAIGNMFEFVEEPEK